MGERVAVHMTGASDESLNDFIEGEVSQNSVERKVTTYLGHDFIELLRSACCQSVSQQTDHSTPDLRYEPQVASQVNLACRRGSQSLRRPAAVPNGPEHSSCPTDASSAVISRDKEVYRCHLYSNHP
jgi:hypothetical protein